ncbi:MAG: enoyl-CoA hydratase/isomerase family protein [Nevskiales bacterium]
MLDRIEHANGILELRLNRPPVNAIDPALTNQLRASVAQAPRDGARALILSGREGMYSGGLDVPALLALDPDGLQAFFRDFFTMLRTLAASEIPIAAAITGHSPAGGAVLSCFCDWRVMAQGNYRFGFNEVAVGIIVPTSVRRAITRMAGAEVSERMSVEARLISPEDALRLNLVHELAPPAEVVSRARAWCERILAQPARATTTMRRLAREDLIAGFEGLEQEAELFTDLWYGEEGQRTLRAMVEKLKSRSK